MRDHFDRITRAYLRSVLSDEVIEEHRTGDAGHPSEPLSRLLAWCQRRPLSEQYAVKAEADGSFRLIGFSGRRGQPPRYVGDERYASVRGGASRGFSSSHQGSDRELTMAQQKIFGYANRISVRPGDEISFHVNCDGATEADAQLVRLIHGDTHEAGPGHIERRGRLSGQRTLGGQEAIHPARQLSRSRRP